jgi:hypothetical protein
VKLKVQKQILDPYLTGWEGTDQDVIKFFTLITASMDPSLEAIDREELLESGYDTLCRLSGQGPTENDQNETSLQSNWSHVPHEFHEEHAVWFDDTYPPINTSLAGGMVTLSDLELLGVQPELRSSQEEQAIAAGSEWLRQQAVQHRDDILDRQPRATHLVLYAHSNGRIVHTTTTRTPLEPLTG